MKKKDDEENFDEAVAQAYKAWTNTVVSFKPQIRVAVCLMSPNV